VALVEIFSTRACKFMVIKNSLKFNTYEEEKRYIAFLKKIRPWLIKNGYSCNLPTNFDSATYTFHINTYNKKLERIKNEWQKKQFTFFEKISYFFNCTKQKRLLKIRFTFYGMGGSYHPKENMVVIKINSQFNTIHVIKHEIIHLLIDPFIKKYKIDHNRKEELVEIILDLLD
jgi:hypothetical protein